MAAVPLHLAPGTHVGAYRIDRLLGSGGFADVYLARHVLLDQPVALKIVRESSSIAREQQGARLMCRLRHPHVVAVNFADRVDDRLVIAMDYVEGETLRARLDRDGTLPLPEVQRIGAAVCDALHYVHTFDLDGQDGFAHLDLKPANILLDRYGSVRIADFGLAEVRRSAAGAPVAGSPAYMAPEQLAGRPGPASDVWALGVLLHEMATGELPVQLARDRSGRVNVDRLPGRRAAAPLGAIVERCLEVEPAARFTAMGVAEALVQAGGVAGACPSCGSTLEAGTCPECTRVEAGALPPPTVISPSAVARPPVTRGSRSRSRWLAAAAVLVLAAAGVAGTVAYRDNGARARDEAWQAAQAIEQAVDAGYTDRIAALDRFVAAWPDTEEAAAAGRRREAWAREAEAFAAADRVDHDSRADASSAIRAWEVFLAVQTTGVRRSHAEGRLAEWRGRLARFAGWVQLTVVGATGLPVADFDVIGDEQADPYFVLRGDGEFVYRSLSVRNAPAPAWRETARLYIAPGRDVTLDVFDRDPVGDDLLVSIPLTPLPPDGAFTRASGSIAVSLELQRER